MSNAFLSRAEYIRRIRRAEDDLRALEYSIQIKQRVRDDRERDLERLREMLAEIEGEAA